MELPDSGVPPKTAKPPSTRYQGSKLKLLPWIGRYLDELDFGSALDVFGGTACVSYFLKSRAISTTYNDYLRFNHLIATAIVDNDRVTLPPDIEATVLRNDPGVTYDRFIEETFAGIYFTDDENRWL